MKCLFGKNWDGILLDTITSPPEISVFKSLEQMNKTEQNFLRKNFKQKLNPSVAFAEAQMTHF